MQNARLHPVFRHGGFHAHDLFRKRDICSVGSSIALHILCPIFLCHLLHSGTRDCFHSRCFLRSPSTAVAVLVRRRYELRPHLQQVLGFRDPCAGRTQSASTTPRCFQRGILVRLATYLPLECWRAKPPRMNGS